MLNLIKLNLLSIIGMIEVFAILMLISFLGYLIYFGLIKKNIFLYKQAIQSDQIKSIKSDIDEIGYSATEGAGITFVQEKNAGLSWKEKINLIIFHIKTRNHSNIGIFSAHKRLHGHGWKNYL